MTEIWLLETEDRKEYLTDKFIESNLLKYSQDLDEFENAMIDFLSEEQKTRLKKDLQTYLRGEKNKKDMIKDLYERSRKKLEDKRKKEREQERQRRLLRRKYKDVEDRSYQVSESYAYGYIKGKKTKVRVEKYLKKGNIRYRYRDSKGRFASFDR